MASLCPGESSARHGNHDRRHPDQRLSAGGRDHHRRRGGGTNRNADQRLAAAPPSKGAPSQGKVMDFKIKAHTSYKTPLVTHGEIWPKVYGRLNATSAHYIYIGTFWCRYV